MSNIGDEIRPLPDFGDEIHLEPPRIDLSIPPAIANSIPPLSETRENKKSLLDESPMSLNIDKILKEAEDAKRSNMELKALLVNLLPAMSQQLETNTSIIAELESNNTILKESKIQHRKDMETMVKITQNQIDILTQKLEEQGQQVKDLLQQVGQDVQGATQDIKLVTQEVKQVGENVIQTRADVNLGRQENITNFASVKTQINDFQDLAIANFNDLKKIIKEAGTNAISGCLPIKTGNFQQVINSILRCFYYFGVFMIYLFKNCKDFYFDLREKFLTFMSVLFGWVPLPNLDKMIRLIWLFFEICFTITLINTIGNFFGFPTIATDVCVMAFALLKTSVLLFFQTIWWIILNNPITQSILIPLLRELGIFSLFNWIMVKLSEVETFWNYIMYMANAGKGWKNWVIGNKGGGANDIMVLQPRFLSVTGNLDTTYSMTLNNYGKNINEMMSYMHSILTNNNLDPKFYDYFNNPQTIEVAKNIQEQISLIENIFITGSLPILNKSIPSIQEITGGKIKGMYSKKKLTKKNKSKKRSLKSKRGKSKRRNKRV
jgi:hypothetical protein